MTHSNAGGGARSFEGGCWMGECRGAEAKSNWPSRLGQPERPFLRPALYDETLNPLVVRIGHAIDVLYRSPLPMTTTKQAGRADGISTDRILILDVCGWDAGRSHLRLRKRSSSRASNIGGAAPKVPG